MTIIDHRREHFGFGPAPESGGFAFDSIQVEYAVSLADLAKMGPASLDHLTRLNPHLYRGIVPAGGYWVWVPTGEGEAMQRAWLASHVRREQGSAGYAARRSEGAEATKLAAVRESEQPPAGDSAPTKTTMHAVAEGEPLWGIAHQYGVSVAALQRANGLDTTTIVAGQALKIPAGEGVGATR